MMTFIPGLLIGLLLLGAALVAAVTRYRPRWVGATAVTPLILALLLWLGLRTAVPVLPDPTLAASAWPTLRAWQVDAWTWSLGGVWLVVLLAAALLAHHPARQTPLSFFPQRSLMLLIGAVTLATLWAGTPALLVTAWLASVLVWAVMALFTSHKAEDRLGPGAALILLPGALGLWYAAALAAAPSGTRGRRRRERRPCWLVWHT
ncbi:MAG: hypothetical protein IPM39_06645 [Chloroflexi bacterium]|nr:hypothetical protein [Chloroflexota bacterium]